MRPGLLILVMLAWRSGAAGFEGPTVWPVQIEISVENEARLRMKPREPVPARVRLLENEVHEVHQAKVRLKGRGTFQALDGKPSFTIEFEKEVRQRTESDRARWHGPDKFHLNNSVEDPSFLKERIGSEIFEAAGIPTPRVGHARVTLNGRELGLYVLKEGFTEDFLGRHFDGKPGNLYDTDEGKDIDEKMELEIGESENQEELKRLAAAAKDPDLARRWERLERALDLDRVLSFMAVEVMICHWDGYGLSRNNFRVYHDSARDKVLFLPAGMDQIFSKADLTWKPNMIGLAARAVLETAAGREAYERKFRNLLKFRVSAITNRVAELVAGLEPFLERKEIASVRAEGQDLSRKIAQREISLWKQLGEGEAEVPKFVNGVAALARWEAFDEANGGKMVQDPGALVIVAGPRTAASWRKTVRLKPGGYVFGGNVRTSEITTLPFGNRHGATLRVIGGSAQSKPLMDNNEPTQVECVFEVNEEREVTLGCELRASGGEARFEGLNLKIQQ